MVKNTTENSCINKKSTKNKKKTKKLIKKEAQRWLQTDAKVETRKKYKKINELASQKIFKMT